MKNKPLKIVGAILLYALSSQVCYSQLVTSSPFLEAQQAYANSMLGTIMGANQTMEQLSKQLEDAKKKTDWVKDLKTVVKLAKLIESTICGLDKFSSLSKSQIGYNNCFFNFSYEMHLIKLTAAAENLSVVLTGFSMERNARMQLVNNSIVQLEEAHTGIETMTVQLAAQAEEKEAMADMKQVFLMSPYRK